MCRPIGYLPMRPGRGPSHGFAPASRSARVTYAPYYSHGSQTWAGGRLVSGCRESPPHPTIRHFPPIGGNFMMRLAHERQPGPPCGPLRVDWKYRQEHAGGRGSGRTSSAYRGHFGPLAMAAGRRAGSAVSPPLAGRHGRDDGSSDWHETLPDGVEVVSGMSALESIARSDEIDTVVAAIVGIAGLASTWSAVESGKRVALANKETMVAAGPLMTDGRRPAAPKSFRWTASIVPFFRRWPPGKP